MKLPWVSREAYDERGRTIRLQAEELDRVRAHRDTLMRELLALRREGFTASKPGRVREAPDVETIARKRADEAFVAKARASIMHQTGVDPVTAQREAERLRAEVTDMHPAGG